MFAWLRKLFRKETDSELDAEQELVRSFLRENPEVATQLMKLLAKDFEARSRTEDRGGGSSSSPVG